MPRPRAWMPHLIDFMRATPRSGLYLLALLLLLVIALAGLPSLSSPTADPPPRTSCTECHDDFVPFSYSIDAPTEVPTDTPFEVGVTVSDDGPHSIEGLSVVLTITGDACLVVEQGGTKLQRKEEQGSLGFRGSTSYTMRVNGGAQGARVTLDGTGGFLDDLNLAVRGPDGGDWSSAGSGVDESITLSVEDILTGGFGDYVVTVDHPRGIRQASFTLAVEVEYGMGSCVLSGPDLNPGDSHTFTFKLRGTSKGSSGGSLVITGTCVYTHKGGNQDQETVERTERLTITVGSEFVYGGSRGGSGGDSWEGILADGRYLGFLAAGLLATSIVTSGRVRELPRRGRLHCWSSYALVPVFIIHWTMLWLGPYGSTLGGIGTGSVLLGCIAMLTLTGVRPNRFEGRVLGLPSKTLHRYIMYLLVLTLVIHAALKGTDLAFLRFWEGG